MHEVDCHYDEHGDYEGCANTLHISRVLQHTSPYLSEEVEDDATHQAEANP